MPTGYTMNGQSSFTIAPDTILEFEVIGTSWMCVSKEWELIGAYSSPGVVSIDVSQYRYIRVHTIRPNFQLFSTTEAKIADVLALTNGRTLYALTYYDGALNCQYRIDFDANSNIVNITKTSAGASLSSAIAKIYGMK